MATNPYEAPRVETSRAAAPGIPGQPEDWTIGEALGSAWDAVKRQPLELVGGYTLVFVIGMALQQIPKLIISGEDTGAVLLASLISFGISLFVNSFLLVGQTRVALAAVRGETVDFGLYFSGGDRFGVTLIALFLMYLGIGIGMVFLIVPGLILLFGWTLTSYVIADTDASPTEALGRSWELTRGHRLHLFGYFFVGGLLMIAGVIALLVGVLVAIPVVFIGVAEIYVRLTGTRTRR